MYYIFASRVTIIFVKLAPYFIKHTTCIRGLNINLILGVNIDQLITRGRLIYNHSIKKTSCGN